ncbi:MAG TPA: PQQ-binding-like beta-propeller repeat protein [Gemmataceae bacterium]|nr:PQQ-binding-like beta-propeller repeat protein [Gemmataceae bacterium]
MQTGRLKFLILAAFGFFLIDEPVFGADWPRFRGPNGTGIALDKGIPVQWSETNGILCKTPIPGTGHSSPIIWGERIFLQSSAADGSERRLFCLDATDGKVLWSEAMPAKRAHINRSNSMASSTPATDGKRVYTMFWDGQEIFLSAFDFTGKMLWKQSLGGFISQHGPGTSPMVVGDKVFVANDQDGSSELFALDANTGSVIWKVPRKAYRACYSTPFVLEKPGQKPELIVGSTAGITSYQPDTGEVNWSWTWKFDNAPLRTVASPIFSQGLIFASSGDGSGDRHTVVIKADGKGDVSSTNLVWENKKKLAFPYVPSFLAWGDHLYFVNDKGFAKCVKANTGEIVWDERLGENISASPILINGNIYAASERGTVYVFPAAPQYSLLAKNSMGEDVMATPSVANNRLYIRGKNHLFCIGKGQ